MEIQNYSFNIGKRGYGRIRNMGDYHGGDVITPHGFVCVYAQGDGEYYYSTQLEFIFKRRVYVRQFDGKRYSPRFIVTLAHKFAEDILEAYENALLQSL